MDSEQADGLVKLQDNGSYSSGQSLKMANPGCTLLKGHITLYPQMKMNFMESESDGKKRKRKKRTTTQPFSPLSQLAILGIKLKLLYMDPVSQSTH